MAEVSREIISDISRVLNSIRSSFDVGGASYRRLGIDIDIVRHAYLRVEEIRFSFRAITGRYRNSRGVGDRIAIEDLANALLGLIRDDDFMSLAEEMRYRLVPTMGRPRDPFFLHPALSENTISAADAINFLLESIRSLPGEL